jgi:glycerophosphoryl diester phosphodiesterase
MDPLRPPLAFAHRGSPAEDVRENTLPAFRAAVANGVTALESDVWLTADDVPVLVHDEMLRVGWHRARIRDVKAGDLPAWLPGLADLYAAVGPDVDVSLDLKDADAAEAVLHVADEAGATRRLWLCATSVPVLVRCRALSSEVRLANSTTLRGRYADVLARRLVDEGIDALNLREPEWTPARVEILHATERLAFALDVQDLARLRRVLRYGCDAVYSDYVELLLWAQQE